MSLVRSPLALIVVWMGLLLAVAGCAGSSSNGADDDGAGAGDGGDQTVSTEVKVEAGEFFFKLSGFTVKAGEPVDFIVTNAGKVSHNLGFPELVAAGKSARTDNITPGESKTLTVTFDEPGEYGFDCSIPGHTAAGMKGTVTAVE